MIPVIIAATAGSILTLFVVLRCCMYCYQNKSDFHRITTKTTKSAIIMEPKLAPILEASISQEDEQMPKEGACSSKSSTWSNSVSDLGEYIEDEIMEPGPDNNKSEDEAFVIVDTKDTV